MVKRLVKALVTVALLAAVGGGAFAYYKKRQIPPAPEVTLAAVTQGDIADTVGATGTLQAVTTVQVGSQVSGMIEALYADFNTLVHRGQVLARLDPSLFQTQIEQARANLVRARADVERLRVALDDAHTKLERARELSARKLIPQIDLESADVAVKSAEAQLRSAEAQVTQAEASLNQNEVNLQHTVIESPIDGLVISRNVDVGQTVAASMQAPTLFVLAADLTKMQVIANLDESDIGRIRPGQHVTFRVDAYPAEDFVGTVSQVRLQPVVQQNVVTYGTVIDVPNPELKLKPGMTANVTVEIARRTGVIRIPNSALRFRPSSEMFAALGQTPPEVGPPDGAGRRRATNGNASPTPDETVTQGGATPANSSRSGQGPAAGPRDSGTPTLGNGPQRQPASSGARASASTDGQALPRMSGPGSGRFPGGRRGTGGATDGAQPAGPRSRSPQATPAGNAQATTVDALFGPLPPVESTGRVWLYSNKQLRPARVRLGISDGQATELLAGDIEPGTELVTMVTTGEQVRSAPGGLGGFPFMGQPGRLPRSGGGGGGGQRQGAAPTPR